MRLHGSKACVALIFIVFCVIQCEIAVGYRSEIEITPAPPEEETTKKSGFFSGIKNFFRGSDTTTTTTPLPPVNPPRNVAPQNAATTSGSSSVHTPQSPVAQKPPPLVIPHAPLMPLGPRPDTPPSSPLAGNVQQAPQWPQGPTAGSPTNFGHTQPGSPQHGTSATSNTPLSGTNNVPGTPPYNGQQYPQRPGSSGGGGFSPFGASNTAGGIPRPGAAQPSLPPGFPSYHPPRAQPSGLDLSYGGGAMPGGRPQGAGRPGLAPLTSSTTTTTTTTTTTPRSAQLPGTLNVDMRGSFGATTPRASTPKDEYPPLPPPRRPSVGAKEDFPALPTPRSPSPTPASPLKPSSPTISQPSSPSAWGTPTTPVAPLRPGSPTINPPASSSTSGGNRVAFVPHVPSGDRTSENSGNSLATDDEIRALTEQLYTKETSQLHLVHVNPQGQTRSIDSTDEAPQPLLEVDPRVFDVPTIAKMRLLFNNYEDDTLTNEYVTPNERKEENDFVDAVMATPVMRQAMLFLQNKGIVSPDPKTHRDLVKELWFTQYSRGSGKIGSSGFEHVFVHEVKNGTLIGLHNWVYFADEEKAGNLDYKGYLKKIDLGTKAKVLKVRFVEKGINKPVNGLFVGTTPELELAVYTVCFKLRPDRTCPVSMGNSQFGVVTYSWRYRGKSLIGSAYPEL